MDHGPDDRVNASPAGDCVPAGVCGRGKRPVLAALAGLMVAAVAVGVVWGPTWRRIHQLRDPSAKVRRAALRELGGRDGHAAASRVRAMITGDPDPAVREAAAYAAMKLGDRDALPAICATIRADAERDSAAQMLATLARLCEPAGDALRFVEECAASGKPYLVIGAAMARTEWFQAGGLSELLAIAASPPGDTEPYVRERIRQYLVPAAELVGMRFDTDEPWPPERTESMRRWWQAHGNDRLLGDALRLRRTRDVDLREIGRLEHARHRVGRMLGLL